MPRGKRHSAETKAAAVAALLAGQSVAEVAKAYDLSRGTVMAWRQASGVGQTPIEPEKKAELGDLIAEYLREVLTTLSVQARFARNEAWLLEQDASEVAVLHGVLTDKAVRILSAIDAGDEQPDG